jgi:uncharacterized membrane protein YgaE (UPF0421/DUF939 family)
MAAIAGVDRNILEDSARTALAAVASFLIARLLRMPEAYWATISTIIVMQSTLGAALTISWQRFAGTVLGAAAGALLSTYFHANLAVFGAGVFLLGLICAVLRLRSAYRFSGVTLAITMLIVRDKPAWMVAWHRFVEVSVGIAVGLAITAVWPTQAADKR